jgi:hypothetical protein
MPEQATEVAAPSTALAMTQSSVRKAPAARFYNFAENYNNDLGRL